MSKVAITFKCIDNFGKEYSFVEVCTPNRAIERAHRAERLSTEILDFEVIDCQLGIVEDSLWDVIHQIDDTFKRDDVTSAPRSVLEKLIVDIYEQFKEIVQ